MSSVPSADGGSQSWLGTSDQLERPLIDVRGLTVQYGLGKDRLTAVRNVSLAVRKGDRVGIVGESGSGKSTLALSMVGFLPSQARIPNGQVLLDGRDLGTMSLREARKLRGQRVALVMQQPASGFNPSQRVGHQIGEVFRLHSSMTRRAAHASAVEVLGRVAISEPAVIARRYPHQLSGGQLQRAAIAMAVALGPELCVLDEPTAGLDATVEIEVLRLLRRLHSSLGMSMVVISHDFRVIDALSDRVCVMYSGEIVEFGPVKRVLVEPCHPYTIGLLEATRRVKKGAGRLPSIPPSQKPTEDLMGCKFQDRCAVSIDACESSHPELLRVSPYQAGRCLRLEEPGVRDWAEPLRGAAASLRPFEGAGRTREPRELLRTDRLTKRRGNVVACDAVSITLRPGEVLGLVGESGSGKTTLLRCIGGLERPDAGEVIFNGKRIAGRVERRNSADTRAVQFVFQNPDTTLNPKHTVGRILERAVLRLGGEVSPEELLDMVEVPQRFQMARPQELSGGLKQRIAIARAVAGKPQVLLCDEPVSALDASIQAAILNLLLSLQGALGCSLIFVTHSIKTVEYVADRLCVMQDGRIVEEGPTEDLLAAPMQRYTVTLVEAADMGTVRGEGGRR